MTFPWFWRREQTCEVSEEQRELQYQTGEEILALVKQLLPRENESIVSHFHIAALPRNGQCYTIVVHFNHRRERELVLQVDVLLDGTVRGLLGKKKIPQKKETNINKTIFLPYLESYLSEWQPNQALARQ